MVAAYDTYLYRYPRGDHASLARERISEIQRKAAQVKNAAQEGVRLSSADERFLKDTLMQGFNMTSNYGPKWDFDVSPSTQKYLPLHVAVRNMAAYPPYHIFSFGTVNIAGRDVDRKFRNLGYVKGRFLR